MAQYDVDLRDYWRILKKRKLIIGLMVLVVGLSSYGFAKYQEPVPLYESVSAVKIDETTSLAAVLTGSLFSYGQSLDTHAYIITSFPVLLETSQSLGWLPSDATFSTVRADDRLLGVVQQLKGAVTAERQEATNIINIRVSTGSAADAANVANALADTYRLYNIREKNRKTIETKTFIEKKLDQTALSLQGAEEKLRRFKETNALIAVDTQTQNLLGRLNDVDIQYQDLLRRRNETNVQLVYLADPTAMTARQSEGFLHAPTPGSPMADLRIRLGNQILERENLLLEFTDAHPRVVELGEQIQSVAGEIARELQGESNQYGIQLEDLQQQRARLNQESIRLPQKALALIRLEREVAMQESLYSQLKAKYQETLIHESGRIEEVSIVRPALIPDGPYNIPAKSTIVITGLIMGLVIGVVLAFGLEIFDTSMGTIEDVEELLQVPVLGVIPFMGREERRAGAELVHADLASRRQDLITHYDPKSLPAEAFRALRSNLDFMRVDRKGKVFLVTSAFVQEGKTFNVVNLALIMAQAGHRILLVEADLRKPVIHRMFGLNRVPGLTDVILGNYTWQETRNTITDVMLGEFELEDILRTPGLDNLNVMPAGTNPPNPAEILGSNRFKQFLEEAGDHYDLIFIDAPPVLPVADATEIATMVDGVLLVYTVGKIGRGVLKRAKSTLDHVDANVMGVILNNVKPEAGPDYFKYHTQYYYGEEEK